MVASSWMHVLRHLFCVDIKGSQIQPQNLLLSSLTSWPQVWLLFSPPVLLSNSFMSLLALAGGYHFPLASFHLCGSSAQPKLHAVILDGSLSNFGLLRSLLTCRRHILKLLLSVLGPRRPMSVLNPLIFCSFSDPRQLLSCFLSMPMVSLVFSF